MPTPRTAKRQADTAEGLLRLFVFAATARKPTPVKDPESEKPARHRATTRRKKRVEDKGALLDLTDPQTATKPKRKKKKRSKDKLYKGGRKSEKAKLMEKLADAADPSSSALSSSNGFKSRASRDGLLSSRPKSRLSTDSMRGSRLSSDSMRAPPKRPPRTAAEVRAGIEAAKAAMAGMVAKVEAAEKEKAEEEARVAAAEEFAKQARAAAEAAKAAVAKAFAKSEASEAKAKMEAEAADKALAAKTALKAAADAVAKGAAAVAKWEAAVKQHEATEDEAALVVDESIGDDEVIDEEESSESEYSSEYETDEEEAPAPADVPAGISGRVSARRNGVTGEEVDEDDLEKLQAAEEERQEIERQMELERLARRRVCIEVLEEEVVWPVLDYVWEVSAEEYELEMERRREEFEARRYEAQAAKEEQMGQARKEAGKRAMQKRKEAAAKAARLAARAEKERQALVEAVMGPGAASEEVGGEDDSSDRSRALTTQRPAGGRIRIKGSTPKAPARPPPLSEAELLLKRAELLMEGKDSSPTTAMMALGSDRQGSPRAPNNVYTYGELVVARSPRGIEDKPKTKRGSPPKSNRMALRGPRASGASPPGTPPRG